MRNGKNRLKYFKISLRKMEQICMSIMNGVTYCAKSISICPCKCKNESRREEGGRNTEETETGTKRDKGERGILLNLSKSKL